MRIFSLVITILCLYYLAPCTSARPYSSSNSSLMNTQQTDQLTPLTLASVETRRFLKSSSSKSKPAKSKKKSKKTKWKGHGKPTVVGSAIGASVFVGVVAVCAAFVSATEKREEDPNWRLRTFLRRKLKRKYTIKRTGKSKDHVDEEKDCLPEVVKAVESEDVVPLKKVESEDVPVSKVEPPYDVK